MFLNALKRYHLLDWFCFRYYVVSRSSSASRDDTHSQCSLLAYAKSRGVSPPCKPQTSPFLLAQERLDKEWPFFIPILPNAETRFQNSLISHHHSFCWSLVTCHQSQRLAHPALKQLKSLRVKTKSSLKTCGGARDFEVVLTLSLCDWLFVNSNCGEDC